MADRRQHKRAPAKGRAKVRREARRPPRTHRSWGTILRGLAWLFGPPVASALLLTLAFPPAEISWLAYVALVPLLVTAIRARTVGDVFASALVAGIVFFAVNLYWIQPITTAGYLAVLPYLALYWAAWAVAMRWLGRRLRVPLALAAPVVWVALEWIRGWALSGLPWLFVGHTQYENLALIQTADALGAYGPSALCLATTGLAAGLLVRPILRAGGELRHGGSPEPPREGAGAAVREDTSRERERAVDRPAPSRSRLVGAPAPSRPRLSGTLLANLLVVILAWAGTVGYGWLRLAEAPEAGGGPVVASVQTNVPQEIKLKARLQQIQQLEREMMEVQLGLTDRALSRAADRGRTVDLVCWPETMVPGILNREFLEADLARLIKDEALRKVFRHLRERSRGYWRQIHAKARQADVPILSGAHAVELEGVYRLPGGGYFTRGPRMNTAFLIKPGSEPYRADHRYAKAHLVPFGEYVPFKKSWPWLHEVLQAFTPYEYDHSLTPGAHDQPPFVVRYGEKGAGGEAAAGEGAAGQGGGREARFQVAICYEDAMAYRIREMVRAASRERKRAGRSTARSRSRLVASRPRGGSPDPPRADDSAAGAETRREESRRRKAVDFIVNISNDGWFSGSWELDQHLNLCVFRAVENRVPVVRSVNTGISAIIQSTGRITRVVARDGERRGIRGCIVGEVVLDDRLAPYTVHGDAFAYGCLLATAGLAAAVVVARLHDRRRKQ